MKSINLKWGNRCGPCGVSSFQFPTIPPQPNRSTLKNGPPSQNLSRLSKKSQRKKALSYPFIFRDPKTPNHQGAPNHQGPIHQWWIFVSWCCRWPRNRRWRLRNWPAWQPCRWGDQRIRDDWGVFRSQKKTQQRNTARLLVWGNTFCWVKMEK